MALCAMNKFGLLSSVDKGEMNAPRSRQLRDDACRLYGHWTVHCAMGPVRMHKVSYPYGASLLNEYLSKEPNFGRIHLAGHFL
jgi:hypothetical protein